jgi:O-antigen/teichoic acid export membrane protein
VRSRGFLALSLKSILASRRARQTGVLYVSLVTSLGLGIAVSVINTRFLGPEAFGDFKFIQTIWTLSVLFVTFGFFTTGGNLLAEKEAADSERPLMGSMAVLAAGISLAFTFLMIGLSFPLGQLYGDELGHKIRLYSALLFVFPFQVYLQDSLRGTNDIYSLALLNVLPQFLYIPAALAANVTYGFSLDMALLLYLLSMAVTVFAITLRTNPAFTDIKQGIREVVRNNKAIGFHIYLAVLVTTATAQLSQFSLAFFYDTRLVGIFALAITITMPLTMIPNAIATTFYKHFAGLDRIPAKVIVAAAMLSVATLVAFLAVIKEIILFLYSVRFIEVVSIAYICAVAAVLRGMGDLFNRYLLAHNMAKVLRTNAMHLGVISALGYIVLVAEWDVTGAAITKFIVDVAYLLSMIFYYRIKSASRKASVS